MTLTDEVKIARKEIVSDGYDMSIGEVINLYRDKELVIDPEFQRLFRWDETRKTRFIESLLLGIPIPPIFVFQNANGVWELIDGLQRLSTIFEFVGILVGPNGEIAPQLKLNGTNFLPSLEGKLWENSTTDSVDGIGQEQQLNIKRARLRVEILKKESDPQAKFELFQRLNTGGAGLTEQEVRNSIAVMLNKPFHEWLVACSNNVAFVETTNQTDIAIQAQTGVELVLRFFAFRNIPYRGGLDYHEYLDSALLELAKDNNINRASEQSAFERTFAALQAALGSDSFKRWDGQAFKGKFLMSVYEVLATGISQNIDQIYAKSGADRNTYIVQKAKDLWTNQIFTTYSGAGIRGTTRLSNLLPMAEQFMRP